MKRFSIISLIFLTVVFIAAAIFALYQRVSTPQSSQPTSVLQDTSPLQPQTTPAGNSSTGSLSTTHTKESVLAALQNQTPQGWNITIGTTAIVGEWALQLWSNVHGGGEALLTYDTDQKQWVITSWGGGAWSVEGLVQEGVPNDVAVALLVNMPK